MKPMKEPLAFVFSINVRWLTAMNPRRKETGIGV